MRPDRTRILNDFLAEDPIFNANDRRYFHVERFTDFQPIDGGAEVRCRLRGGTSETLRFHFYANGLLRVRFGQKQTHATNSIELNVPPVHERISYELEGSRPCVAAGSLKVVFQNLTVDDVVEMGTFTVLRGDQALLGFTEASERAWFNHISYQLGRGEDREGRTFSYFTFDLGADEHLYGGGEQFSDLDQTGRRLNGWITDTLGLNSTPLIYKWVPFFLSSRKFGVFFNSSARATADIGNVSFTSASFKFVEPTLDFFLFTRPTLRENLGDYTALTGRPPRVPAWSYGVWMSRCAYRTQEEVETVAEDLRRHDFPADVIHVDPAWLRNRKRYSFNATDFIWDRDAFPDPEQMCRRLKDQHLKVSLWVNPYLWLMTGPAHEFPDLYLRDKAGDAVFAAMSNQQAIYDFTREEAARFYRDHLKKLLRMGIDVLKTDYGENVPEDGAFANGETGTVMHNLYPYLYNRLAYEAAREEKGADALVFGRSGFAGSQRFPVCWSGDSQATWGVAPHVLRGGLNAAISGIPFWSCDIGGFVGQPDDELFVRWAQFGLLISHARFHGNGFREPWRFGKRTFRIVREFARLRYRLITYLHNLGIEACGTGLPVIRPMVLEFEDDPVCRRLSDQYMLGHALLIKPVLEQGATSARVYLPAGQWKGFLNGQVHEGPGFVEVAAPLDTIPIFQRQNTIIPMNRTMSYVDEDEFDELTLRTFAYTGSSFEFFVPGRDRPQRVATEGIEQDAVLSVRTVE